MTYEANNRFEHHIEGGSQRLREFLKLNVVSSDREIDRITKYYIYWHFYEGRHYKEHNDSMLSFNYIRAFIDKVIQFTIGDKGFSLSVSSYYSDSIPEELEKRMEELILYHWRRNNLVIKATEILQMGSITGEAWVLPYWDENEKFVKIRVFDSRNVYVEFDEKGEEKSIVYRDVQAKGTDNKTKILVTRYTKNLIQTWTQNTPELILDPKSGTASYIKDLQAHIQLNEVENPLGVIPVVHIKNKPNSAGYFSSSDAADLIKINKVFNELNQELKGIIDYHATPVTIVTGANLKNEQRRLGSIWSGLPPEANVFNLGLDADLSSMTQFVKDIKTYMHEIGDVPENVLGKLQAISGTSAAAVKLTFQPLVQQADKKATCYGEGIAEVNKRILKILETYDSKNKRLLSVKSELDKLELEIEDMRIAPVFSYGLPSDRMVQLQEFQMENLLKIGSRKEWMNTLGKNNVPELLSEIEEDNEVLSRMEADRIAASVAAQQSAIPPQAPIA